MGNPAASKLVIEIQQAATIALTQAANINGLVGKYNAVGGSAFIAPHFVDENNAPRTDLGGLTAADMQAVIDRLALVAPILNAGIAELVKIGI